MNTDPIADMLTRIRNAIRRQMKTIKLPHSRLKAEIGKLLVERGYLDGCEVSTDEDGRKIIILSLRYQGIAPAIEGIRRISKPGQRIYEGSNKLNKLMIIHTGDTVVSTTKGLMTGRQAIKAGLGGEVLFRIW
ncbi:30S ribosomal protein S8 [Patescibacteria group bacterium]|nr:30S ribosomal protein S8 [Patescibacteria group bacterium]